MKRFLGISVWLSLAAMVGCSVQPGQLKKTIEDNPDIIANAMEKHPEKFLPALEKLSDYARKQGAERQQAEMKAKMEEDLKNPKKPVITEQTPVEGNRNAPIFIVGYSDFQCPYCKMAFSTMEALKQKYGDKMAYVHKNLPLPFHPMAMPAAKRFVAITLQDVGKAYKFHDYVFENQDKLQQGGEKFLDTAAEKVGVNMAKLKKDLNSEEVKNRIEADSKEAKEFGVEGTPGFNVNGVMVRGALPQEYFEQIIEKTTHSR
jgi:protein-disulfide isomerase